MRCFLCVAIEEYSTRDAKTSLPELSCARVIRRMLLAETHQSVVTKGAGQSQEKESQCALKINFFFTFLTDDI